MSKYPYIYLWGNNPKRMELKGKRFKIIKRGKNEFVFSRI